MGLGLGVGNNVGKRSLTLEVGLGVCSGWALPMPRWMLVWALPMQFRVWICLLLVVACLRDFSEVLKDAAGFFIFVSVFLFGGNAAGFGRGLPQRDPLPLSVGDASARGK